MAGKKLLESAADEIERLTRAKADWEECVALRDAEIERLTRERDEWKNGHTMTDLRLTQLIEECERLRAALGAVYPYLPDSTSAERARSQIVSEALRGADETTKSLGPPDCICPKCGAYIMNPWDEPRVADKTTGEQT